MERSLELADTPPVRGSTTTTLLALAACLIGLASCGRAGTSASGSCAPDLGAYFQLEDRARSDDPLGTTAKSALRYLAQEKLPSTGFYISRKPVESDGEKVQYELLHESGFDKPCADGNRSGFDGILEIDPTTRQVRRLLRSQ
jgi:hypothetical protein